jgi:hypothetical protein
MYQLQKLGEHTPYYLQNLGHNFLPILHKVADYPQGIEAHKLRPTPVYQSFDFSSSKTKSSRFRD